MLHCTACIRRYLRAITGDAIDLRVIHNSHLLSVATTLLSRPARLHRKHYATAEAHLTPTPKNRAGEIPTRYADGRHDSSESGRRNIQQLSQKSTGDPLSRNEEEASGPPATLQFDRAALEKEIRWLRDPMKLSEHTVTLLRKDEYQKALELVRMSSRTMACTVSWNHMLDYEMYKGRVSNAMKIYNDMKKRAQQPDAHTFTILLRGLAWHTNYPTALQRAISLYHSMYAENSPVRPTIIHTNAVLKVCARAKDLDSLWGVAARLPRTGRNAPDTATFTTILNAIYRIARETARETDLRDTAPEETASVAQDKSNILQQTVLQGRRMWAEIIERWRNGDIKLDEDLICSMGRLLVLSDVPKDLDDVLSLVEQTMGIHRQVAPLSSNAVHNNPAEKRLSLPNPVQTESTSKDNVEEQAIAVMPASDSTDPTSSSNDDFIPGQEFAPTPSTPTSYVLPSQNTLSLIVTACTHLHSIRAAQDYWSLLTSSPYNITPDTDNYHTYLRLLRLQRASRLCVSLVSEMRDGLGSQPPTPESERCGIRGEEGGVQAKTFRIAMSACIRDINNPNVLTHASKLCRMMIDSLPRPDMRAFSMFLDVGLKTAAVNHDWRLLSSVLRGTEIGVRGLRNHLNWEEWGKGRKEQEYKEVLQGDLKAFLRKLVGAYDWLVYASGHEMMPEELKKVKEQRGIVGAWETKLGRLEGRVQGRKPAWAGQGRKAKGKGEDDEEEAESEKENETEDDPAEPPKGDVARNTQERIPARWSITPTRSSSSSASSWGHLSTTSKAPSTNTSTHHSSAGGQWKRMLRAKEARTNTELAW